MNYNLLVYLTMNINQFCYRHIIHYCMCTQPNKLDILIWIYTILS